MKVPYIYLYIVVFFLSCNTSKKEMKDHVPHVVFIIGDHEYRSEESMPMIGGILERELGAKISYCFAMDDNRTLNPSREDHIDNLKALKTADLVVFFTRFRALPDNELKYITDYVESGKPVVGFRTSTHTFLYKDNAKKEYLNNEWAAKLFGQQWVTHHGHFDDGKNPLTSVSIIKPHSILNSIKPFDAYSWLYHVDGGDWKLNGACDLLLQGKALKTSHETELDKFPISNPVAWTKTYTGKSKKTARVFFTTLGHPYDFKNENMRKLAVQGMYWALGKENLIPKNGLNVTPISEYNPSNSGMSGHIKNVVVSKQ